MLKAIVFTKAEWNNFRYQLPIALTKEVTRRYKMVNLHTGADYNQVHDWLDDAIAKHLPELAKESILENHVMLSEFQWGAIPRVLAEGFAEEARGNLKVINLDTDAEIVQSLDDFFLSMTFSAQQTAATQGTPSHVE